VHIDWVGITSLAYIALLALSLKEFPIPTNKIQCKGVKIISYQKYAKITGASEEDITLGHELEDAFLLKGLRPNLDLIFYDKKRNAARVKHSLWHEIGHIVCDHNKHGDREEIEAHFFASQANAPNIVIKNIAQRGYNIDVNLFTEYFGLSEEAAYKKTSYLSKHGFEHTNDYDDAVLEQFSEYINAKYPVKSKHFYDDYFDNLERERETWY